MWTCEGGFIPDYQPIKGKEDVISDLKKAAKRSGKVYLATDRTGRRGHLLAPEGAAGHSR